MNKTHFMNIANASFCYGTIRNIVNHHVSQMLTQTAHEKGYAISISRSGSLSIGMPKATDYQGCLLQCSELVTRTNCFPNQGLVIMITLSYNGTLGTGPLAISKSLPSHAQDVSFILASSLLHHCRQWIFPA